MLSGIVLAAGASTRMGRSKALLDLGGEAAVSRVAHALARGGCDEVVVVAGEGEAVLRRAVPLEATVVANREWRAGRSGSVQTGLRAVSPVSRGIVLAPVDVPLFTAADVERLALAEAPIAVLAHDGVRGHPVLFAREVFPEIFALAPDEPLSTVVHRLPARVAEVETPNPGILLDLDRPEDYERAKRMLESAHATHSP